MPRICFASVLAVTVSTIALAQSRPASPPTIADEPKTIDPATLMPDVLAKQATVKFAGESLLEVAQWFAREQGVKVLVDKPALDDLGIPLGEPVHDHLADEPLYLLLDRLKSLELSWWLADDLVQITTAEQGEERQAIVPYNLGDLIDSGYDREVLADVVLSTIAADTWAEHGGGDADVQWLGDVMFVRQTSEIHRQIEGLLEALRKHGRRTFIYDPPQHIAIREKLDQPMSLMLDQTPLVVAAEKLAEAAGVDVRLDRQALAERGIREREAVTLDLEGRSLRTVLGVALNDLELTWLLEDGVLWITSGVRAKDLLKTAVYDVRDLCRDAQEGEALMVAILSQMPENWAENGVGEAEIRFAKDGVMVVSHNEAGHEQLLSLLERYRTALRISKPRAEEKPDPNEMLTKYYRMPSDVALGLTRALPILVAAESWESDEQPDAAGTILLLTSDSEVIQRDQSAPIVIPQSVLIIEQTRENHEAIAALIDKVRNGDAELDVSSQPIGGVGGGGFGGGAF